ncbi:MAG: hypothetical protein ACRDTF_21375, partial [Pseudonocardiaceae bacterium]
APAKPTQESLLHVTCTGDGRDHWVGEASLVDDRWRTPEPRLARALTTGYHRAEQPVPLVATDQHRIITAGGET